VVGAILGYAGYVQSMGKTVIQPESATHAIYLIMGCLPAFISFLGILALFFYTLTEDKLKATTLLRPAPAPEADEFPILQNS
jgi:Na+/melibiose symporter-like transporter